MSERTLPPGWVWTTIGEITQPVEKVRPREHPNTEFVYIDISSIDNTIFKIVEPKHYIGSEAPSRARQLIHADDVLFSTVRTYLMNIAMVPEMYNGQIASTGFSVLRSEDGISAKYLFYYCLTPEFLNPLEKLQRGTSYPAVRDGDVREQSFPLPPLPEQHRIVAEIEKQLTRLDAGVAALQRAQANLQRYKAAVLKAACEGCLVPQDPADEPASALLQRILAERRQRWEAEQIARGKDPKKRKYKEPAAPDTSKLGGSPEGWVWATLEQILIDLKNGYFGGRPSDEPIGVPILRINAVRPMSVSFDVRRYLPEVDTQKIRDYELEEGDLLFTRYNGSRNLAGACGLVRISEKPLLYPDKLIRVRVGGQISPNYLEAFFVSTLGRFFIEQKLKTTAGQYGIAGNDLKQIPIPIPPLCEQQRIVTEVERRLSVVEELEAAVEANLKRAGRLRQAVLKRAFEGKLVPQDPSDEPATVLLERMRAKREGPEAGGKSNRKSSRQQKRGRGKVSDKQLRLL
jgi:type I restriction enzyme S subunit